MNTRESLLRIIFLSLLLYSLLSLAASGRELRQAEQRYEQLSSRLETLMLRKHELQEKLEEEISDEELEQLARRRLGLVRAGEKIFYFTTDREG